MSVFGMSEEDKKKILQQHKDATKSHYVKQETLKKGIQVPEKKQEEKPSE
jgi:hypothetical protein